MANNNNRIQAAVYVAPQIPMYGKGSGLWSPISCTLIYSGNEAVLVDTPITRDQTTDLIRWIERIAPGRKLSYIYITHGHGDHFFGLPLLVARFPEAKPVATAATIAHMQQQTSAGVYEAIWESRFPGQIAQPFVLAAALPRGNEFVLEDRWAFRAIEVGHTDTYDSTVLWVPEIKLVVCGDVVYGQVHQMLFEADTREKRAEWVKAIEIVEALEPAYVVSGHKQPEEMDGVWHLANTKKYIKDFESVLDEKPKSARELVGKMQELYPDRMNPGALILSAMGAFKGQSNPKI